MKKLLSTITALSIMTASTAGLSVSAFGGFPTGIFKAVTEAVTGGAAPTATPTATASPTEKPTNTPEAKPTDAPTAKPTNTPEAKPTDIPTEKPTEIPTEKPTDAPTATPEVTDAPVIKGLEINKHSLTLKKGESFTLTVATEPADAPSEDIEWSSTNDCVKVGADGTVTAVSSGSAIVSATAVKSRYVASCYISVENEDGIVDLSVTDGVAQVIITKDGESDELTAGANSVEAGVYEVTAKSVEGYRLKDYASTITVEKDKTTSLLVAAEKTTCAITLPSIAGVTVTPVNGSVSPVELGGSYSFTVNLGSSYNAENLVVKANGTALTAENGIYTVANITDDVVITIDGVESKSWDATLKSVKVKGHEAVLGADNTYTVTIPYGDTASLSDIEVTLNDAKSEFTVTSDSGYYVITVKAEDGTTNVYKLAVTNAEATAIDSFKVAVSNIKFGDVIQSSSGIYNSQETVMAEIEAKIKEIADEYPDVKYTIEKGESLQPVKGTLASPTGVDGYYRFTITLSTNLTTAENSEKDTREIPLEIKINGYDYTVSAANITATTTTMTIRNLEPNCEVALYLYGTNGKLKQWTAPTNGSVTFSNLTGGESYVVKMRAQGSNEIPTTGTTVTMQKSKSRGTSRYYTVTFDEGTHGKIVSGKTKQSVRLTGVAAYPTVQADDGYIFKGWSANGVLVENPKTYYIRCATAFTAIYEKSSGSTLSSTNHNSSSGSGSGSTNLTPGGTVQKYLFTDVPATSWYYNSVTSICNKGYMNGTMADKFEPDSNLTRGMLVTVLYRYACEPEVNFSSKFNDVPGGMWYSDAVAWAADAGIVNGITDTTFEPDTNITREQLATIMYRYCEAFGYDTSAAGNIIKYSDSALISDWAQTSLIWTTGAGIIEGKEDNRLDPQGNATRAEAATIIERFDDFVNY